MEWTQEYPSSQNVMQKRCGTAGKRFPQLRAPAGSDHIVLYHIDWIKFRVMFVPTFQCANPPITDWFNGTGLLIFAFRDCVDRYVSLTKACGFTPQIRTIERAWKERDEWVPRTLFQLSNEMYRP